MPVLVTGEIEFPQDTGAFSGATAYISLESNAIAGMPSTIIVENTVDNFGYDGANVPFEIKGTVPGDSGGLNLRVHISLHGSDDVQKGDYLTKRSHTALKDKNPDTVLVKVDKV